MGGMTGSMPEPPASGPPDDPGAGPAADTTAERTLALAGIFQSLSLVREIAYRGEAADHDAYAACIASVFRIDAPSAAGVYGGAGALRLGLETLLRQLDASRDRDVELARYCAGTLVLERKLVAQPALVARLRQGIEALATRAPDPADDEVTASLAALYQETLSTLPPRIMVSGEPAQLMQERVAARIRALLLAAVRSAVLWRQLGGSRLGLLLSRRRILRAARALLEAIG